MRNSTSVLLCALAALAGLGGVLYLTPHGIGLSPDSLSYLGGARGILAGNSFSAPATGQAITQHTPLYSWLLALAALPSSDPSAAARWLSAIMFAINILLLAGLARKACGTCPAWIAPLAALAALSAAPMWHIHLMAWSEPLFIALCLAAVWLFASYLEAEHTGRLYAAATATALAMLARYAGLFMWLALVTLLLSRRSWTRRRSADLAGFSLLTLVPFSILLARNYLEGGSATNRLLAFHPVSRAQLQEGLTTVSSWLMVPANASGWIKSASVVAAAAFVAAGLALWSRSRQETRTDKRIGLPPAITVSTWSAVAYGAFLLLSISFADANIPLDQRILAPLLALVLVPAVCAWYAWRTVTRRLSARVLALAAAAVFVAGGWAASFPELQESRAAGIGFHSVRWRNSDIIRALRTAPAQGPLYSNMPDGIAYWTGREAKRMPVRYSKMTGRPDPGFASEMERLRRDLAAGALVVYFHRAGAASPAEAEALIRELELRRASVHEDGIIYAR